MAVIRSTWRASISENFQNSYPCPRCNEGRVRRGEHPVVLVQPHYSSQAQAHEDWDIDWVRYSFTTMLKCDIGTCGEMVAVSGRAVVEENHFYEYEEDPSFSRDETYLQPVSMFPAPPLFPIAKSLPPKVQNELKLAFQLFWTDRSVSTSRLRTSLERVLDERGVLASKPDKNGKSKKLSLFERIDLFEKSTQDSDITESLNAMRVVGNLGTHGDEVSENDYFDLLDVYEDALAEIYDQKSAKLKAAKLALIALNKP